MQNHTEIRVPPLSLEQWNDISEALLTLAVKDEAKGHLEQKLNEINNLLKIKANADCKTPVWFTFEAWSILNGIYSSFRPDVLKDCTNLVQNIKQIWTWLNQDIKLLPEELISKSIIPSIHNPRDIRAFRHTCSFFYNNQELKKLQEEKYQPQLTIIDNRYSTNIFIQNKKALFVHGKNKFGEVPEFIKGSDQFGRIENAYIEKAGGVKRIFANPIRVFLICNDNTILISGKSLNWKKTITKFEPFKVSGMQAEDEVKQILSHNNTICILSAKGNVYIVDKDLDPTLNAELTDKIQSARGVKKIVRTLNTIYFLCGNGECLSLTAPYQSSCRKIDLYKNDRGIKDIIVLHNRLWVQDLNGDFPMFDNSNFAECEEIMDSDKFPKIFPTMDGTLLLSQRGKVFLCDRNKDTDYLTIREMESECFRQNGGVRDIYPGYDCTYVLCDNGKLLVKRNPLFLTDPAKPVIAHFEPCADSVQSLIPTALLMDNFVMAENSSMKETCSMQ